MAQRDGAALRVHLRRIELQLRITASAWAAKASLSSIQSTSAWLHAGLLEHARDGLDRADAHDLRRHAGDREAAEARDRLEVELLEHFSLTSSTAPAPSDICELLPAVTEPFAANTGRSLARPSAARSGRGPSSCSITRSTIFTAPLLKSGCGRAPRRARSPP
jgi:hypothetical protein